jgi:hypothetical protein
MQPSEPRQPGVLWEARQQQRCAASCHDMCTHIHCQQDWRRCVSCNSPGCAAVAVWRHDALSCSCCSVASKGGWLQGKTAGW